MAEIEVKAGLGIGSGMADSDQMRWEELLTARARVTRQIERLSYRDYFTGIGTDTGVRNPKAELMTELQTVPTEIDTELAELGVPPSA
jgi:hypothetical protein